jgi:hypothetical protein
MTLEQSQAFDISDLVNRIAAGPQRNLQVTAANSIYQHDDRRSLLTSFTFPDNTISYGIIAVGDGQVFAGFCRVWRQPRWHHRSRFKNINAIHLYRG